MKVSTEFITPGQVLAEDIYSGSNWLLPRGIIINHKIIDRLKKWGVQEIAIEATDVDQQFNKCYEDAKNVLDNLFYDVQNNRAININPVANTIKNMADMIFNNNNVLKSFEHIRHREKYTFIHSVDVAVLAILIGCQRGYSRRTLYELGTGAALHDIGKVRIPVEILNKKNKLDEQEFIEVQKHTIYGHELLQSSLGVSYNISCIALMHHERLDGKGYPFNLHKGTLPEFVRITSVADVYSALTLNRPYRKRMTPSEAIEVLWGIAGKQIDLDILRLLFRSCSIYPVGCKIRLNDGRIGEVMQANPEVPTRPIIKLDGGLNTSSQVIDLNKQLSVVIEDLVIS
ncbi:HD-GYP domain-containing protein [Desulfuribacillus alkaliarsenatis]|uniref:HD-GYP domain-containing protein n=1 Tax=Desulfuribacillus alkaliarsenatis TaxID=766136 RepID=A0A1E5G4U1_9FIRM|nr:HD-GYP domain-containing protein [Desulfuribacillus alkaliarsenatis]OEF98197.1 hypothetical protein BHF68_00470 [Desulfuribacillus alkaliarsenatis]